MRILDEAANRSVKEATILLTSKEAKALYEAVGRVLLNPRIHHVHIRDDDAGRQIALAIYAPSRLSELDERSQKLVATGE